MDRDELVFRKKALSRKNKIILIIVVNISILTLLILATKNLDILLFDQVTGEARHGRGKVIAILAMCLPIMLLISTQLGISKDKSIHVMSQGLGFNQPNPFSKPIPWSQIKSLSVAKSTEISFEFHDSSEYSHFSVKLQDYGIRKSDLPVLIRAIEEKISQQPTHKEKTL